MVAYPFISLIYYSFLSASQSCAPQGRPKPVGFENYAFLLSDPDLWEPVRFHRQVRFLERRAAVPARDHVAYILQRDFRGRDVIFTVLMLPMMLCPIVVGFLWRYMFNSEWGVVNYLLTLAGFAKLDWLGVTQQRACGRSSIADTWMWTPFVILLATAAFRGVPEDDLRSRGHRRRQRRLPLFHA